MSGLPIFLRPSTKFLEIDLTQRIDVLLSTTAAVVGEFERGSLNAEYQSGIDEDFRARYGEIANPAISFAHDTVTSFMTQSGNVLVKRVVKDAKHAGSTVLLDTVSKSIITVPFESGTDGGYDTEGLLTFLVFNFTGSFIATNSFTIPITDGSTTTSTAVVTYATSHNATLENIAVSIQNTLNTFGVGSKAWVYTNPAGGNNNKIFVRLSKTMNVEFGAPTITGSVTLDIDETARLFDVFAENPGSWGNNYGYRISNIDTGIRERYNLTFAGAFVSGNSITATINGTPVTETFDTDSDTTLENLAEAIAALPTVDEAVVQTVPGGTSNDRTILIVAKVPGPNALNISVNITGGSSQTAYVVSRVMTGIAADNSFTLSVYNKNNVNVAVENFTVALPTQLDSRGYQQNITQVVNRSSGKSINIRVLQPAGTPPSLYNSGDPVAVPTTISWLAGGDNGVKVTSAELRQAWQSIDDRVQYPFSIMLNAGYTAISVQKEMADIAEKRSDCIAILDAPSDRQGAQDLRSYRVNDLDLDTSYAAMYTPDVEIEDIKTGERRFIPPSGPVGATYAYSDRLTQGIGAPAGLNRGHVRLAVGLRHYYTIAEQELLYPVGINYIQDKPLLGPVVMAEETLQVKKSVLSSVHARRILNLIKTGLVDGLDYTLFEPNTDYTRFQAVQLGDTILGPMTDEGGAKGLYEYRIKCDDENNTSEVIDADQLAYDVYLKITRVIKGILVRGILTRTGASFEEIIL